MDNRTLHQARSILANLKLRRDGFKTGISTFKILQYASHFTKKAYGLDGISIAIKDLSDIIDPIYKKALEDAAKNNEAA